MHWLATTYKKQQEAAKALASSRLSGVNRQEAPRRLEQTRRIKPLPLAQRAGAKQQSKTSMTSRTARRIPTSS